MKGLTEKDITAVCWLFIAFIGLVICCYTWFQIGRYVEQKHESSSNYVIDEVLYEEN